MIQRSGRKVLVSDERGKRSKEKLKKFKGKSVKTLNQNELRELVEILAEKLGLVNERGELV